MDAVERVHRLAALANLELTAREVARFAADLPTAMAHMEAVLAASGGDGGEWLAPAPGAADDPRPSLPREQVLALAPRSVDGYIMADLPRGR